MSTSTPWMPAGAPAHGLNRHQHHALSQTYMADADMAATRARQQAEIEAAWAGITERAAVLLTPETSRRLMPATIRHPHAEVILDALVETIDREASRALVRLLLLTSRAGQTTHSETHWLERSDIDRAAGHPPSVWDPLEPHRTAIQRAHLYGPETDPWLSWRPQRQWEAQL